MNMFFKKLGLLIVTILGLVGLFACTSSNFLKSINEKDFIIVASAIGSSKEDAKRKALANLAQQVTVSVDSDFKSQEILLNDNFNINVKNNITLLSQGYFQGVVYFNEKKINKNSYETSVGITNESLVETINFLSTKLIASSAKIDFISKFEMNKDLQQANFLLSLYSYARIKSIIINDSDYQAILKYQQQLDSNVKAVAQIKFLVYPNDKNVVVTINNKVYKPFMNIYLNAQKYNYSITLNGYKEERGTLNLSRGSNFQVNVYLQKQLSKPFLTKLEVNNDKYNKIVTNLIYKNQMKIDNKSYNVLIFNFQTTISNKVINNYYNILLPFTIEFYKGNLLIKSFQANISYLANDDNEEIPLNIIQEQLEKNTKEFFANIYD